MNILYDKHLEAINENTVFYKEIPDDINVKSVATKSAEITESIACEFAEWLFENTELFDGDGYRYFDGEFWLKKTTQELFKLFLESKI